ncbi:MAG: NifU family protein [Rhodospirillaceae bacterium]|nr:NifU family protein [Rhodospirillaceae bacterium]
MFIQTEETPNPASLKFLPGKSVLGGGTMNFTDAEAAEVSPLAVRLFQIPGVTNVFFGTDFVTVTKAADKDWFMMKPPILGAIMEHFVSGDPVVREGAAEPEAAPTDDDEVVLQIKELLDTRVRPAVAMDGGDIVFEGFENGIVYLQMHGACSGCPSSTMTLKAGIENMLRHYIPEVTEVRPVP